MAQLTVERLDQLEAMARRASSDQSICLNSIELLSLITLVRQLTTDREMLLTASEHYLKVAMDIGVQIDRRFHRRRKSMGDHDVVLDLPHEPPAGGAP